jgi:hypothetical protein
VLDRPITVAALVELAVWLAIPYLAIGGVWTFFHADKLNALQAEWAKVFPVAADVAALGETVALWPVVLLLPNTCQSLE